LKWNTKKREDKDNNVLNTGDVYNSSVYTLARTMVQKLTALDIPQNKLDLTAHMNRMLEPQCEDLQTVKASIAVLEVSGMAKFRGTKTHFCHELKKLKQKASDHMFSRILKSSFGQAVLAKALHVLAARTRDEQVAQTFKDLQDRLTSLSADRTAWEADLRGAQSSAFVAGLRDAVCHYKRALTRVSEYYISNQDSLANTIGDELLWRS